jgi:hypothetical protein
VASRRPADAAWLLALIVVLVAAGCANSAADQLLEHTGSGRSGLLIVARRGDIANFPENTLEGVTAAAERGADGIEFDLNRSADGTWYLLHDADVSVMTDGVGRLETLEDVTVSRLRIDGRYRVPSLHEVLDALGSYDGLLMLDVKDGDAKAYAGLAHTIVDRGLVGRARISVYWHSVWEGVRAVRGVDDRIEVYFPGQTDDIGEYPVDRFLVSVHDLHGPVSRFDSSMPIDAVIGQDFDGDEAVFLERAADWGVVTYLTNDLDAALTWDGR